MLSDLTLARALCFTALALTMAPGPASAQTADRPPIHAGDEWHFVEYWGTPSTTANRVWKIGSVTATVVRGTENGEPLELTPALGILDSPNVAFSNPKTLSFPLEVGSHWRYTSDWAFKVKGSAGSAVTDVAVVAHEKVTTPAGEFDAFKLLARTALRGVSGINSRIEAETETTYWYAPTARAIVKTIYRNPYLGTSTTELVRMRIRTDEIRILAGSAIQPVMTDVVPAFERTSGHRVVFEWGAAGGMAERVAKGDKADLAVVTGPQMTALERDGKIRAGTRLDLGKTGVGVFVRKGAPKPEIGTVESFRQAMLAAKSIGYNDPAAGAPVSLYLIALFERMGIAEEMKRKTVVFKDRAERFGAVARGDVEIGFNQVSEIIAVPTVDLVGPLPDPIQNHTLLSIASLSNSDNAEAAAAFVRYLATPDILATFRQRGFSAP